MIHVAAFTAMLVASVVYILIAGGKPERLAVLAMAGAFLLTIIVQSFRWTGFEHFPLGLALIDVLLAALLTILALRANRLWPIVLAAMQITTVLGHLARALSFPLPAAGYAIFVQFWGWPMLIVAVIGAYRHHRRRRRLGEERDWKPLWPHSVQTDSTT